MNDETRSASENELLYSVWLSLVYGIAEPDAWRMSEKFGGSENACRELFMNDSAVSRLSERTAARLRKYSLKSAEKVCSDAAAYGMRIMLYSDEDYPNSLRNIEKPPAVLYLKGSITSFERDLPLFAMVGTRNPTKYSVRVAASLSKDLCLCGFGIVSGFATGIDIVSHLAACNAGGRTFAVLGCGIDCNYPKDNFPYRHLIEEHGAFISEFPPGRSPIPSNFISRNRIIAGLCCGTAVIEAGAKSGSAVTANFTVEQNKTVFTVPPGNIFDRAYAGNVRLLRSGSPPVMSARDIVNEYYGKYRDKLSPVAAELYSDPGAELSVAECVRKISGKAPSKTMTVDLDNLPVTKPKQRKNKKQRSYSDSPAAETRQTDISDNVGKAPDISDIEKLPEEYRSCAAALAGFRRPATADEIAAETGCSAGEILGLLTEMEIDGIVRAEAGSAYSFV